MDCQPSDFPALKPHPSGGTWKVDHARLRGANYFSLSPNPLHFWRTYDRLRVEAELAAARRIGINSLRVFLSYEAFRIPGANYLENLEHLLSTCCQRGLVALVVVVDFAFGWNGKGAVERWSGTPGIFFMADPDRVRTFEDYLAAVAVVIQKFPDWLVMLDLANEPSSNPWWKPDPLGIGVKPLPPAAVAQIGAFMIAILKRLTVLMPGRELTVGEGLGLNFSDPDFLHQYHFSFQSVHGGYTLPQDLAFAFQQAAPNSLVPVVVTETAAAPALIPLAVQLATQTQRGFMFWALMKGFHQWNSFSGLLNPVTSSTLGVTNLAAVVALNGSLPPDVVEQPVPPGFVTCVEKLQVKKAVRRLLNLPALTREDFDEARSLTWELTFWNFFAPMPAIQDKLVEYAVAIEQALKGPQTHQAYDLVKLALNVARAGFDTSAPDLTPGFPASKTEFPL